MDNGLKGKIESKADTEAGIKAEAEEFRFKDEWFIDGRWWATWWPEEGTYNGYTKREASEKAKEVYMSLKDKIWPGCFRMKLWLDSDFVMDIVRPGGEEAFRKMVNEGRLADEEDYAGYEWRITN